MEEVSSKISAKANYKVRKKKNKKQHSKQINPPVGVHITGQNDIQKLLNLSASETEVKPIDVDTRYAKIKNELCEDNSSEIEEISKPSTGPPKLLEQQNLDKVIVTEEGERATYRNVCEKEDIMVIKKEEKLKKASKEKEAVNDQRKGSQKVEVHSSQEVKAESSSGLAKPEKSKAELKAERKAIHEAQRAAAAALKQSTPAEVVAVLPQIKDKGTNEANVTKSKSELRAERRALQEAQRAVKSAKKTETSTAHAKAPIRVPDNRQADIPDVEKKMVKKLASQQVPLRTKAQKKVKLFGHLHQYERELSLTQDILLSGSNIHPAVVRLGLQYAEGIVCGSNARCVALVHALKQLINDYTTPPQKELPRDLEARLKPNISFLQQCRPISVSMGNVIKYLKMQITNIPSDKPEAMAKETLIANLDNYVDENIKKAHEAISLLAQDKIADGDVILTYACSSLVKRVLIDAHRKGIQFRVIVVDARPKLEGRNLLHTLVAERIKCSYVLIHGVSYVMQEATKVMMGAHALMTNGYVKSRIGTSQVALVAKAYNKPVLICCETYKFCEKVQTDSFVFNELGDPDDLVQTNTHSIPLSDWRDHADLTLLNLVYDVTPPDFVSVVITDVGMIPCTSVPVVLRLKHVEQ